jgi:hypothetical protein
MKSRQRGLTTVEFAIVGALLFILLFAVLEFGRLMYTFAVLGEGTRRAARLAAVCPIGSPNIRNTADFSELPGFRRGNVDVTYLNAAGIPTGLYTAIDYVQVQIVNYRIPLTIPFLDPTVTAPPFKVTMPRESLGVASTEFIPCG